MQVGRVLRGAWARRDLNVGLGLVVAVATAAAVAAPTFAGAAVKDLVRERVTAADPLSTDLSWAVTVADPERDLTAVVQSAPSVAQGSDGRLERPSVSAAAMVEWSSVDRVAATALAWRADLCERVDVSGRCPQAEGEVLVAAGPTADVHPIGDEIVVAQSPEDGGPARTLRLTVVGTWRPGAAGDASGYDASRWSRGGTVPTFLDCEGTPAGEATTPATGALLTDLSTLRGLPDVTVLVDAALAPSADLGRIRAAADHADDWQGSDPRPIGANSCAAAVSDTDIDGVVGPIDDERDRLERQGIGAAAGAVLIGVLAGVLISTVAARRRRAELALVKLRGVRGLRLVREAMAEPLVALAAGAAVGVPTGWLVATVAGRVWLGGDVATGLPSAVWPLVGLVVVLSVLGVATGLYRTLREPVHQQLRPARPRPASAGALLARVAAFVVVLVGVYQLHRTDASDPPWWALTMPVVMGFVAGLVAAWLVRRVAGGLAAVSRRWRGSGAFLGSRRLRRSGDLLAVIPFAMAALVLVVVAGGAWNVGADWRESTALLRTGGPVAIASGKPAGATLDATRRADPEGRWLMAAVSFPEDSGRTYRRLYADTDRWQRVLAPELADTSGDVPSDVAPDILDDLRVDAGGVPGLVRGTRLTLAAVADADWYRAFEPARLTILLQTESGAKTTVALPLEPRRRGSMTVTLPECRTGCRPSGLYLDIESDAGNWMTGTLRIETLRLGETDLLARDWRLDPAGPRVDLTRDHGVLRLRSRDAAARLSLPPPPVRELPVVTAGGLDLASPDNPAEPGNAFGADGQPVPATAVGDVAALPLIGDEGFLGDLPTFLADRPVVPTTAQVVVLARSDTPDSVRAQLRSAGVESGDVRPVGQTRQLLDRDPYAQGLRFFWLAAALVAVIGACAVAVALLGQRGERGHEAAALRVVGLRHRQLRAAVVVEVGLLTGIVAVCGWFGAWASSRAILSVLPVGQPAPFEPGPETATGLVAGLLPAAASAGVLAVAALALLLPMSTSARPSTLRSGGD